MSGSRDRHLLEKYFVPNMGGYSEPGSHLCGILHRLDENGYMYNDDKQWIRDKGMFTFVKFIKDWEKNGKPNFRPLEEKIGKQNIRSIGSKYGIYIRNPNSRLYKIVKRIENGMRFIEKDVIWLSQRGFLDGEIKSEYHKREATHYLKTYTKDGNAWNLVNSSSQFRKALLPVKAREATDTVKFKKIKNHHLKSALAVTRGGAYRDMGELSEALIWAQRSYSYESKSFHPCTLYGAIYYQQGKYELGQKWFEKAVENGASLDKVDSELRAIYRRMKGENQKKMKHHLLSIDSRRYDWVKRST